MPEESSKTDVTFLDPGLEHYANVLDAGDFYNLALDLQVPHVKVLFEYWRLNREKDLFYVIKSEYPVEGLMAIVSQDLPSVVGVLLLQKVDMSIVREFVTFICELAIKDINIIPLHFPLPNEFKENVKEKIEEVMRDGKDSLRTSRSSWN